MFDIGFFELLFLGIITLLVVGPERLPKVARTAGLWLGKARSMVSSVKADIDRELAADELKKTLAKQAELPELYDIVEETESALEGLQTTAADKQAVPAAEQVASKPLTDQVESDTAAGSESKPSQ